MLLENYLEPKDIVFLTALPKSDAINELKRSYRTISC